MKRLRTQPTPPFSTRRGVSLIELVITLGVAGVMLTMGIGTLHLLLRTDENLTHSLKRRQTVSQLSDAFRHDVHAAHQMVWVEPQNDEETGRLTLKFAADHEVQYTTDDYALVRTETRNQETLQSARFRFLRETEITIDPKKPNSPTLVIRTPNTTTHSSQSRDSLAPKRELRIQAALGRNHRFEKPTKP